MAAKRAQHRVAAVVIADVVGCTWPIADGEEGTLACLHTGLENFLMPKIDGRCERIAKLTGNQVLHELPMSGVWKSVSTTVKSGLPSI